MRVAKEKRMRRQRRLVRTKAKRLVWDRCEAIAKETGCDPFDVLIALPGTHPSVDDAVRAWLATLEQQHGPCRLCAADNMKGPMQ